MAVRFRTETQGGDDYFSIIPLSRESCGAGSTNESHPAEVVIPPITKHGMN